MGDLISASFLLAALALWALAFELSVRRGRFVDPVGWSWSLWLGPAPRPTSRSTGMFVSGPSIYATSADHQALSKLSAPAKEADGPGWALLRREVSRLEVVDEPGQRAFAGLGSLVTFRSPRGGGARTARLVMPGQASIHESTVAVTSTLGAALLGLKAGEALAWQEPGGAKRRVEVLAVQG